MKIVLSQEKLAKKTGGIASVVPAKTSLPILSTFLLEAKESKVCFTANDLDVSLTTVIECQLEGSGEVAVPGKKFFEIVRSLPEDDVEISVDAERIGVKCRKSKFKILGKSASEFPKLPEQENLASFNIKAAVLDDMIAKTIYAVSNDLTRPSLCGVLWELKGSNLSLVATDGHRLGKVEYVGGLDVEGNPGEREFIVSPKALSILRSLMEDNEQVGVGLAENHIAFDLGDSRIYSRLLEGPFPDYNQVIPKSNKKELIINREEFAHACKRVAIMSSVITHQIKLSIGKDSITLSVNTPDVGEAQEDVPCTFNADPMEIGYNARYVLDALRNMGSERITFLLDRNDNAGMLLPSDQDGDLRYQCLLMPLRLNDGD